MQCTWGVHLAMQHILSQPGVLWAYQLSTRGVLNLLGFLELLTLGPLTIDQKFIMDWRMDILRLLGYWASWIRPMMGFGLNLENGPY